MNKTFLMATKNQHKLQELCRILKPMGYNVICERDLDKPLTEAEENGTTFEENALLKALAAHRETGLPCVADDSGLCVDALGGAPGVYSARYAGEHGNDEKNNDKLLEALKDVPEEKRTAQFVSAVACVFSETDAFVVTGTCPGKIAFERQGTNGFGYDPLFISELGSFGILSAEQKDSISHRHHSLVALAERLKERVEQEKQNADK
ncbi:MAG: RdgB/HAM1 family non-canonical purine NTP pyrophosphatase [Clostridia bacterium]|nr:RdgB/HAM1 family non-canonical purine NTP pyrophosphatase [Clostridia bacterium]